MRLRLRIVQQVRAQATAEMAVTIAFIVGAAVAMALYVSRAYQGYLYAQTQSHGQQFDPNSAYIDTRTLAGMSINQQLATKLAGKATIFLEGYCDQGNPAGGGCAPDMPASPIAGQTISSSSKSQTNWDFDRNATYTAN